MKYIMSGEGGEVAESKPKSKITLYIVCHGADMPRNKIVPDSSVRILSQAGKFGCLGFFNNIQLAQIKWWIKLYKILNSENTYEILEYIQEQIKMESYMQISETLKKAYLTDENNDQLLKGIKTIDYRKSRHTEKARELNEDWQIYTPIMEHVYDFKDKTQPGQGIFIVDIINKPESCKLEVDDNLLRNIGEIVIKDEFKKMPIKDFLSTYSIFDDDTEKEREILKIFDDEIGCDWLDDYVLCLNDAHLRIKLFEILGQPRFDKILLIIHENYLDLENNGIVWQSKLIKFLKDEGFDIINIIDKSCRSHSIIMSKDQFVEINGEESKASESIDKTQGGKKQTRKKQRKKQRKFKTKSQRKSKTTL